jgi:hypothetical protein
MNREETLECLLHDLIYDFLILMKDKEIFQENEYGRGYIDSLFETYKMLQDKLVQFNIDGIPAMTKMPDAEEWHRSGPSSINLE